MSKIYPFKFLDAYNKEDTSLFFGRDEEINALYQMVFQSNLLMIYGASGTGKTSLIQCGLAGRFQSHDWLALFIRRGNNLNNSFDRAIADAGGAGASGADDIDLSELFDDEPGTVAITKPLSAIAKSFKAIYLDSFRPIYLIFDQFEELFILGTKEEQAKFIDTVREILMVEQPVKIIFSIREEYLGYLGDFEKAIPELMRKKLRVEPMNIDKVNQVIKGVTQLKGSNISLKNGEEKAITEAIFDKIKGSDKTLTIQLPYLQVFLDKLYLHTTNDETRQADAVFSLDTIKQMGDIGDVLLDFLEEQVKAISKNLSTQSKPVTTDDIWSVLSPFATLEGTKEPISMTELIARLAGKDKKLVTDTVVAFVNSRILRRSDEGDIYELAHDTLAKKIAAKRSEDEIELLEVRRIIKNQVNAKKDQQELFSHRQLARIEASISRLTPTEEELRLINDSRRELRRKRRTRNMRIAAVIIALIVVLIIITIQWQDARAQKDVALAQTKIAQQKTVEAQNQKEQADKAKIQALDAAKKALSEEKFAELQKQIADSSAVIAGQQKLRAQQEAENAKRQKELADAEKVKAQSAEALAKTAKAQAENEKTLAEKAKAEADRLRLVSVSQNLAFKALQVKNDPQLSALLASQAFTIALDNKGNTQDPQIYNALFQSLKKLNPGNYPPVAILESETKAMHMASDGAVSVISGDGTLTHFNAPGNTKGAAAALKGDPFTSAYLSEDSRYAVTGYDDFSIRIWNNTSGSASLSGHTDLVRAAAFSADGSLVVTGGRDSAAIIWKNNVAQHHLKFPSRIRAILLSADYTTVFAGCEDGIIYSSSINGGKITTVLSNAPARINCLIHIAGKKRILAMSSNGKMCVLNSDGTLVRDFFESKSIEFVSADDESGLIALATSVRQVHIYNARDFLQKPIEISDITKPIKGFALSPQGYLFVACSDNTLRCYSIKSADIKKQLDALVTRKLTEDEWNLYVGKDIPYKK